VGLASGEGDAAAGGSVCVMAGGRVL